MHSLHQFNDNGISGLVVRISVKLFANGCLERFSISSSWSEPQAKQLVIALNTQ